MNQPKIIFDDEMLNNYSNEDKLDMIARDISLQLTHEEQLKVKSGYYYITIPNIEHANFDDEVFDITKRVNKYINKINYKRLRSNTK
jgi:hypothetical protein